MYKEIFEDEQDYLNYLDFKKKMFIEPENKQAEDFTIEIIKKLQEVDEVSINLITYVDIMYDYLFMYFFYSIIVSKNRVNNRMCYLKTNENKTIMCPSEKVQKIEEWKIDGNI